MLSKNKDYKAIKDLDEHLEGINKRKKDIEAIEKDITDLRKVNLSPSHTKYPYGKLFDEKDEFVNNRTILSTIGATVMFLIVYGILFGAVAFASIVFNRFGYYGRLASYVDFLDGRTTGLIILIAMLIVALVIFLLTFKATIALIIKLQYNFRDWRFSKRYKKDFEEAYEKTMSMIEEERINIKREISELTTTKEAKESEIRDIEKTITNTANIPRRFINKVQKLKTYFEDLRVTTIPEGINLLVKEEREEAFVDEIKSVLKDQQEAIDTLSKRIREMRNEPIVVKQMNKEEPENDAFSDKVKHRKATRELTKKERKKAEKDAKKDAKKDTKNAAKAEAVKADEE